MSKKMNWDADADRRLLLAIIKTEDLKLNYNAIAAAMSDDEITLTANAIKKHMTKLNANTKAADSASPKGKKRAAESATPRPKKARRGKKVSEDEDSVSEGEGDVNGGAEGVKEEIKAEDD